MLERYTLKNYAHAPATAARAFAENPRSATPNPALHSSQPRAREEFQNRPAKRGGFCRVAVLYFIRGFESPKNRHSFRVKNPLPNTGDLNAQARPLAPSPAAFEQHLLAWECWSIMPEVCLLIGTGITGPASLVQMKKLQTANQTQSSACSA